MRKLTLMCAMSLLFHTSFICFGAESDSSEQKVSVWLTENVYELSDGEEELTCSYQYDEIGNLLEEVRYSRKEYRSVYTYNEYGDVLTEHYFEDGVEKNIYTYTHTYDADGFLSETVKLVEYLQEDGTSSATESVFLYTYEEEKLVNLCHKYKSAETGEYDDSYETVYTYDSDNNLLREDRTRRSAFDQSTVYEYDSEGNPIKMVVTDDDSNVTETSYYYDEMNRMEQEVRIRNEKELYTILKEYNDEDQLIKSEKVLYDGSSYTDTYTYDEHGNLSFINNEDDGEKYTYIEISVTPEEKERLSAVKLYQ